MDRDTPEACKPPDAVVAVDTMSITTKLGRLERVDLRTAWASEAQGFTPWLGQKENLALLGEAIGLELESQERNVGPFRAELVWHNPEGVAAKKLYLRTDADFLNEKQWPKCFAWLKSELEVMHGESSRRWESRSVTR